MEFDASKEHLHVLDRREPEGEGFALLGVEFDESLSMQKEVDDLANRCHWKLKALLRSRRFFTQKQLVQQYKTHVLPFLEHSTSAVYHATATLLDSRTGAADFFAKGGLDGQGSTNQVQLGAALHQKRRSDVGCSPQGGAW